MDRVHKNFFYLMESIKHSCIHVLGVLTLWMHNHQVEKRLSSLLLLYNKTGEPYNCFTEEILLLFDVASYNMKGLSYRIMVYMCAVLLLICHNNVLYNVYNTHVYSYSYRVQDRLIY